MNTQLNKILEQLNNYSTGRINRISWLFTSAETVRIIRDGVGVEGGGGGGDGIKNESPVPPPCSHSS